MGFVLFGEALDSLEREAGGELRLSRDAGLRDAEIFDFAAAMAQGQGGENAQCVVVNYVRRHAEVVVSPMIRAKQELERHWMHDLPIAMVAEVGGMSATAFTRSFVATYRTSPASYRVMLRANAASRLLWMRPDLSTAAIAEECGFRNPSYFFRTYRLCFGQTPTQARERYLGARRRFITNETIKLSRM